VSSCAVLSSFSSFLFLLLFLFPFFFFSYIFFFFLANLLCASVCLIAMALSALPRPAGDNDSLYFMEPSSKYWHVGQSFSPELKERVSASYNSSLLTRLPMFSTSQSSMIPRKESLTSIREELLQVPEPNSFVNSLDGRDDRSLSESLVSNGSIGTVEMAPQFPGSPREPSTSFTPVDTKELSCGAPGFQKWLKSLCRGQPSLRPSARAPFQGDDPNDDNWAASIFSSGAGDKATSSSSRFVTTIKTASITIASMSIEDESLRRRNSAVTLDNDTIARMRDRKCALEELINTEEYYIADLKVLVNVGFSWFHQRYQRANLWQLYMSILDDCDGIPVDIKDAITRDVSEILGLHEKLLEEIFHALPAASHQIQTYKGRSFGVDSQADGFAGSNILANPMAAAKVAMVFDKMVGGRISCFRCIRKSDLPCRSRDFLSMKSIAPNTSLFVRNSRNSVALRGPCGKEDVKRLLVLSTHRTTERSMGNEHWH